MAFQVVRSWYTVKVDSSQGLGGCICVFLFIFLAVESLVKILSTECEMIP